MNIHFVFLLGCFFAVSVVNTHINNKKCHCFDLLARNHLEHLAYKNDSAHAEAPMKTYRT